MIQYEPSACCSGLSAFNRSSLFVVEKELPRRKTFARGTYVAIARGQCGMVTMDVPFGNRHEAMGWQFLN